MRGWWGYTSRNMIAVGRVESEGQRKWDMFATRIRENVGMFTNKHLVCRFAPIKPTSSHARGCRVGKVQRQSWSDHSTTSEVFHMLNVQLDSAVLSAAQRHRGYLCPLFINLSPSCKLSDLLRDDCVKVWLVLSRCRQENCNCVSSAPMLLKRRARWIRWMMPWRREASLTNPCDLQSFQPPLVSRPPLHQGKKSEACTYLRSLYFREHEVDARTGDSPRPSSLIRIKLCPLMLCIMCRKPKFRTKSSSMGKPMMSFSVHDLQQLLSNTQGVIFVPGINPNLSPFGAKSAQVNHAKKPLCVSREALFGHSGHWFHHEQHHPSLREGWGFIFPDKVQVAFHLRPWQQAVDFSMLRSQRCETSIKWKKKRYSSSWWLVNGYSRNGLILNAYWAAMGSRTSFISGQSGLTGHKSCGHKISTVNLYGTKKRIARYETPPRSKPASKWFTQTRPKKLPRNPMDWVRDLFDRESWVLLL